MHELETFRFTALIEIIGINPFVYLPAEVLEGVFDQADRGKGKIPVKLKIDGYEFLQTLVKYKFHWRLYINIAMRTATGKDVGDTAIFEIAFDPEDRFVAMHPKFSAALESNEEAKKVFQGLRPTMQLEIARYFSFLKTDLSVDRNVIKAVNFLLGKQRFIGRDMP